MVVRAARMTTTAVGTAPPPMRDCSTTAVDNGREELATTTSKH